MEDIGMFSILQRMPLFIGMGRDELIEVVTKIKFDFRTVEPDDYLVKSGDVNGKFWLLTNGEVELTTRSDDYGYSFTEAMHAPAVLQIESTFGVMQRFTHDYRARTTCNLIVLDKNEILKLINESLIFRLNFLNSLSTSLQKSMLFAWKSTPRSLKERLCRFFLCHCQHPAGHKVVAIKMERLAQELNDSRLNVSRALHELQNEGLLTIGRGRLDIPSIEKLVG